MVRESVEIGFNVGAVIVNVFLFLAVVIVYIKRFRRNSWLKTVFILSMSGGSLGRAVYFIVFLLQFFQICFPIWVFNFLYTLPSILLLTTFTISLSYWGEAYARSFEKVAEDIPLLDNHHYGIPRTPELRRAVVVLSVVGCAIFISLYIFAVFLEGWMVCRSSGEVLSLISRSRVQFIIWVVLAILYILAIPETCGFIAYNYRVYKEKFLTSAPKTGDNQRLVLKKFAFVVSFCLVCFVIQSVEIVLWMKDLSIQDWWSDPVYFSTLETVPLASMLYLLHSKQKAGSNQLVSPK